MFRNREIRKYVDKVFVENMEVCTKNNVSARKQRLKKMIGKSRRLRVSVLVVMMIMMISVMMMVMAMMMIMGCSLLFLMQAPTPSINRESRTSKF